MKRFVQCLCISLLFLSFASVVEAEEPTPKQKFSEAVRTHEIITVYNVYVCGDKDAFEKVFSEMLATFQTDPVIHKRFNCVFMPVELPVLITEFTIRTNMKCVEFYALTAHIHPMMAFQITARTNVVYPKLRAHIIFPAKIAECEET